MKTRLRLICLTFVLLVFAFTSCQPPVNPETALPRFSVTYNPNGASNGLVPEDSRQYLEGETVTVKGTTGKLTRNGYVFACWNSKADGTGDDYCVNDTFTMGSSNIVLFAKWQDAVTITLDVNGGEPLSSPTISVAVGQPYGILSVPSREGYRFSGWWTDRETDGTTFGAEITNTTIVSLKDDHTIYASWTKGSYILEYNPNGATSGSCPSSRAFDTGSAMLISDNVGNLGMEGYDFAGWNTAQDGSGSEYVPLASYNAPGNHLVLFAQWTLHSFRVHFDTQGGSSISSISVPYASLIPKPADPVREGYSFNGWYLDAECENPWLFNTQTIPSRDITLYAKWIANEYAITFDAQGGIRGTTCIPALYDAPMPSASGPRREGFVFQGYFSGTNGTGVQYYNADMTSARTWNIARDTTLYACWSDRPAAIVAGEKHSFVLMTNGTLWAWGNNEDGQLGDGTTTDRSRPVRITSIDGITAIACSLDHTVAVKNDGTVWEWGFYIFGDSWNEWTGEVDEAALRRTSPVQIQGLSNIKAVAAGRLFSIALKNDGTVWSWGSNECGELGDGTTNNREKPEQIAGLSDIIAISVFWRHAIALKSDGTVWTWGENCFGQLGNGTTENQHKPKMVVGLSGVRAIAASIDSSFALKHDGTLWSWGENYYGTLGLGDSEDRCTPVQIPSLSMVNAINAGGNHIFARTSDGSIWAWGSNYSKQLGFDNSTYGTRFIWAPVRLTCIDATSSISGGGEHTLLLKRDGTIYSFGGNKYHQLGDGTAIDRWEPFHIMLSM